MHLNNRHRIKPATFAIGVWIDDRQPADRWEPPEEHETTVLLVDGNDERYELSEELEAALVGLIENHSGEICDALKIGTDHQYATGSGAAGPTILMIAND